MSKTKFSLFHFFLLCDLNYILCSIILRISYTVYTEHQNKLSTKTVKQKNIKEAKPFLSSSVAWDFSAL